MGLEQCGRGGLPQPMIDDALRLLARFETTGERLTDRVIAERVGCSPETVRKLRRGIHRSQRDEDLRGGRPARIRLASELLDRGWPFARVARFLGMDEKTVAKISRGEYITQRRR